MRWVTTLSQVQNVVQFKNYGLVISAYKVVWLKFIDLFLLLSITFPIRYAAMSGGRPDKPWLPPTLLQADYLFLGFAFLLFPSFILYCVLVSIKYVWRK